MANRWGYKETVMDFIFLGSKITADSDCSHEIKRHLLLGRKAMTNLDSILKSRHTHTQKAETLFCKIKPVNPKGNQSWIFIRRTDAEAEAPILWLPDAKNWLIWKDPDPGKDWRWEEKELTEVEMVGWHHQLDRHEFEHALGVGDGQGRLGCCRSTGLKSQTWLSNWTTSYQEQTGKSQQNII